MVLDSSGRCERIDGFPLPFVPDAAGDVSLKAESLGQEAMSRN